MQASRGASSRALFRFCQLDFAFPLGPADGRYLARGGEDDPVEVLVYATLSAPRPAPRRARRLDPAEPEPETVPLFRATVVFTPPLEDHDAAAQWLDRCRKQEAALGDVLDAALIGVNRLVHAQRIAEGDPYLSDVSTKRALAIRIGYGSGADVAEGRWRAAYGLPAVVRRRGRRQVLSPQEQVAAILTGRAPMHASEDLLLRARLDFDQGRMRQAGLQLAAARRALEEESGEAPPERSEPEGFAEQLAEMERTVRRRRHRP